MSEVERVKRRLIRAVARFREQKTPPDEMWEQLKKDTKCDCKVLWDRMRSLTIKKLQRLLAADDKLESIAPVAQMAKTDWMLFDLILVHEKVDVITLLESDDLFNFVTVEPRNKDSCSSDNDRKRKSTPAVYSYIKDTSGIPAGEKKSPQSKALVELFNLVQRFNIEGKQGEELAEAWAAATMFYNKGNKLCSPMLLQLRWYQLKKTTREAFYDFWLRYRGNQDLLNKAKEAVQLSPLQIAVAKRFPKLVTSTFPEWEDLIQQREVILIDEFEAIMTGQRELPVPSDANDPDLVVVEPKIETIELGDDSDGEADYISDTDTNIKSALGGNEESSNTCVSSCNEENADSSKSDLNTESLKQLELQDANDQNDMSVKNETTSVTEVATPTLKLQKEADSIARQDLNTQIEAKDTEALVEKSRQNNESTVEKMELNSDCLHAQVETELQNISIRLESNLITESTLLGSDTTDDVSDICTIPSKNLQSTTVTEVATPTVELQKEAISISRRELNTQLQATDSETRVKERRQNNESTVTNSYPNSESLPAQIETKSQNIEIILESKQKIDAPLLENDTIDNDSEISTIPLETVMSDSCKINNEDTPIQSINTSASEIENEDGSIMGIKISDIQSLNGQSVSFKSNIKQTVVNLINPSTSTIAVDSENVEAELLATKLMTPLPENLPSDQCKDGNEEILPKFINHSENTIEIDSEDEDDIFLPSMSLKLEEPMGEKESLEIVTQKLQSEFSESNLDQGCDVTLDMSYKQELKSNSSESDDQDCINDCSKFDLKLLMYPLVYTMKLDDMNIFQKTYFDEVKSDHVINEALNESKPISTKVIDVPDTENIIEKELSSDEDKKIEDDLFEVHGYKTQGCVDDDFNQFRDRNEENKDDFHQPTRSEECSDTEIDEHHRINLNSYLVKKPKYRIYNPIMLCKNPDFNTRLKKLSLSFFTSERNRQLLSACKPMTIDLHKDFEKHLVYGTMFLKSASTGPILQMDKQTVNKMVSVVPSSGPVESLMNVITFNEDEIVQSISKFERKKSINLPDIDNIRKINQKLLTAEVTPMRINVGLNVTQIIRNPEKSCPSNTSGTLDTPIKIENDSDADSQTVSTIRNLSKHETDGDNVPVKSTSLNNIHDKSKEKKEVKTKTELKSKKRGKPSKQLIPWYRPVINNTFFDDSLLTSDALNKMLDGLQETNAFQCPIKKKTRNVQPKSKEALKKTQLQRKPRIRRLRIKSLKKILCKAGKLDLNTENTDENNTDENITDDNESIKSKATISVSEVIESVVQNSFQDTVTDSSVTEGHTPMPNTNVENAINVSTSQLRETILDLPAHERNTITTEDSYMESDDLTKVPSIDIEEYSSEELHKANKTEMYTSSAHEQNKITTEEMESYDFTKVQPIDIKECSSGELHKTNKTQICPSQPVENLISHTSEQNKLLMYPEQERIKPVAHIKILPREKIGSTPELQKPKKLKQQFVFSNNFTTTQVNKIKIVDPQSYAQINVKKHTPDLLSAKDTRSQITEQSDIQSPIKTNTMSNSSNVANIKVYSSPRANVMSRDLTKPCLIIDGKKSLKEPLKTSRVVRQMKSKIIDLSKKFTVNNIQYSIPHEIMLRNTEKNIEFVSFLGRNKFLLSSIKPASSECIQNISLPDGVTLVLLPGGEVSCAINDMVDLSPEQLASLPRIIEAAKKQLASGLLELPLMNTPVLKTANPSSSLNTSVDPKNVITLSDDDELPDGNASSESTLTESSKPESKSRNLLSDLMEMSGITDEDTSQQLSTQTAPNYSVTNAAETLNLKSISVQTKLGEVPYNTESIPTEPNTLTLHPIACMTDLRYCAERNAKFFKLDLDTGCLTNINIRISKNKKNLNVTVKKYKSILKQPQTFVDLTHDDEKPKGKESNILKNILLERRVPRILKRIRNDKIHNIPIATSTTAVIDKPMDDKGLSYHDEPNSQQKQVNEDNVINSDTEFGEVEYLMESELSEDENYVDHNSSIEILESSYESDQATTEENVQPVMLMHVKHPSVESTSDSTVKTSAYPIDNYDDETSDDEPLAKKAKRIHSLDQVIVQTRDDNIDASDTEVDSQIEMQTFGLEIPQPQDTLQSHEPYNDESLNNQQMEMLNCNDFSSDDDDTCILGV